MKSHEHHSLCCPGLRPGDWRSVPVHASSFRPSGVGVDVNGWPNPDKPGYPLDPETEGWHWLENAKGVPWPWVWCAKYCEWENGEFVMTPEVLALHKYLGPALTPAEVEDIVHTIGMAAAEAMNRILADMQTAEGETKH